MKRDKIQTKCETTEKETRIDSRAVAGGAHMLETDKREEREKRVERGRRELTVSAGAN